MVPIDTNLLRAVTKFDSAGRLRAGQTAPAVPQPKSMWRFLVVKINGALRLLSPFSIAATDKYTSKAVKPALKLELPPRTELVMTARKAAT